MTSSEKRKRADFGRSGRRLRGDRRTLLHPFARILFDNISHRLSTRQHSATQQSRQD